MHMLHLNAECFAEILRDGSREAQCHILRSNNVTKNSFDIFSLMNSASVVVLSDRDILVPFFAKCRDSGIHTMIERGEWTSDDPIVNAFCSWFLASSDKDMSGKHVVDFLARSRAARARAFDLVVEGQGFSANSFSPIVRGEEDVVLPFFHVLIQEGMHRKMEKAMLRQEKIVCVAALERAFAWYHFDATYSYYDVDIENFI